MATVEQPTLRFAGPLKDRLHSYDRARPPAKQQSNENNTLPDDELHIFVDAMRVREEVFVHEQKVPLENEFDDDDPDCVHIVSYQSHGQSLQPSGTIRIVPASSHMHQHLDKHRTIDGRPYEGSLRSSTYDGVEPFIKLGRLAVVASQRGRGSAAVLVQAALDFAASHPDRVDAGTEQHDSAQAHGSSSHHAHASRWRGLVLVHAQQQVQRFWARHGFALDEEIGIWDEEGINHVAMWRRVALGRED